MGQRRRGGRSARLKPDRNGGGSDHASNVVRRKVPAYQLFGEEDLVRLETQADWILREIGVEFHDDDVALELFRDAGASVDGTRVRFDTGLVRALCGTAPSVYPMHGRDPRYTFSLGGDHVVLMPGYGSPFVTDLDTGRRYATLLDFENFVKLTYMSPWLHHSGGTVCEPVDVPVNKRHLDMVYAHLRYSAKPFMGAVTAPERARDTLDMVRLVFGADYLEDHVVVQANINVNSPLVFDGTMTGALRTYAAANQSVAVSPAIFGGAMGPVSQAAVIAQTLAEGMVGIALAQLVRRGCPVVFGSFHSTMNLKSGALTFGTPEQNLTTMALAQLGRRLGVPVRSGGGQITAANSADGQAMQDSADAMWAALISGANQVWHSAGWLEGGLTMSYEKFVMDVDHCGAMLRMLEGVTVDHETLARDAYREAGPGQNFLSTGHTLRHFADANFEPGLPEAGHYETWMEQGAPSAERRAGAHWRKLLEDYEAPAIDPGVDEALKEFIRCRKSEIQDQWY